MPQPPELTREEAYKLIEGVAEKLGEDVFNQYPDGARRAIQNLRGIIGSSVMYNCRSTLFRIYRS